MKLKVKCSVCTHPQADEILRLIAKRASDNSIAEAYGFSPPTISSHRQRCVRSVVQAAQSARKLEMGLDVQGTVFSSHQMLEKIKRAADKFLTDPDDPDEYDLGPRAAEVTVVYYDPAFVDEKGKPIQQKAPLQELINLAKIGTGYRLANTYNTTVDTRKLLMEAFREERGHLEFYANLLGLLRDAKKNEHEIADDREYFESQMKWLTQEQGMSEADARQFIISQEPEATRYIM